jgi:hypothetical protein
MELQHERINAIAWGHQVQAEVQFVEQRQHADGDQRHDVSGLARGVLQ